MQIPRQEILCRNLSSSYFIDFLFFFSFCDHTLMGMSQRVSEEEQSFPTMLQKVSLNIPFLTPNGNERVFEVLHGDVKLVTEQGCRLRSGRELRGKPVLPEWQICESQKFISSTWATYGQETRSSTTQILQDPTK